LEHTSIARHSTIRHSWWFSEGWQAPAAVSATQSEVYETSFWIARRVSASACAHCMEKKSAIATVMKAHDSTQNVRTFALSSVFHEQRLVFL
jgi:hypothetical protein